MSEAFFYLIISLGNNAGVKEKFLRITRISFLFRTEGAKFPLGSVTALVVGLSHIVGGDYWGQYK